MDANKTSNPFPPLKRRYLSNPKRQRLRNNFRNRPPNNRPLPQKQNCHLHRPRAELQNVQPQGHQKVLKRHRDLKPPAARGGSARKPRPDTLGAELGVRDEQ